MNIFLRFRKDYYYSLLKKKENGRKSIEKQKNNLGNSYNYDTTFLCFLFLSVSADFRRTSCFWGFQVDESHPHTSARGEKKRRGMMDEVSSLRTGRNSVYCVFAVDCDDDLMDRKENFLLYINSSCCCCCWTSRSIDMNKMMAKQISIDAIFFKCVHINQIVCDPSDIALRTSTWYAIFISFHEPFDYLIVWLLVCRYGAP